MCGSGKGGASSSSSSNTTTPPAYLSSAYQNLVSNATGTASTPYSPYTGQITAPINGTQSTAINNIAGAQGIENPYIGMASSAAATSQANPWSSTQQYSPSAVQNYDNPYQTSVVNATMANINNVDAQQAAQLQGNAVSSNALGGDRAGIAQAELANQQGLAAGQTLSQLQNQGYAQAQGEFNTEQSSQLGANEATGWLNSQAANTYGNLGTTALNDSLTGSNALLGAGTLEQGTTQAQDTANYGQYEQAQAYPYQQEDWLSGILTGLGGVAGGTTAGTSSTSQAGASPFSQFLGLGEAGLGAAGSAGGFSKLFSARGGAIPYRRGGIVPHNTFNRGGIVPRFAAGGPPTDFLNDVAIGWVPKPSSAKGRADFPNAYRAPSPSGSSGSGGSGGSVGGIGSAASGLGNLIGGSGSNFSSGIDGLTGNNNATQGALNSDFLSSGSTSALSSAPDVAGSSFSGNAIDASSLGSQDWGGFLDSVGSAFKRGGPVGRRHYAIGGEVLPDILSGVGDIVGAFFGDPGAGSQGTAVLSGLDGGRTDKGLQLRRGGLVPHRAFGGGMSSIGGNLGAARHLMPRPVTNKTPDLLKTPKFDDGGSVGGLAPSGGNSNPMVQSAYQRYANLPQETLQELAVRYPPGSPQGSLIQKALQQKQTMPAQQAPTATGQTGASATATAPNPLQTPSFSKGGAPHYDAGGGLGANDIDPYVTADNGMSMPLSALQAQIAPSSSIPMPALPSGNDPNVSQGTQQEQKPVISQPDQGGIAAQRDKEQARFDVKPDPWQALMAAGFATMAGGSRNAGQNIGQGALAGLENYTSQEKMNADKAYKQGEVDDAANKLMQEAEFHKDSVSQEQQKIDQTKAYESGMLANDTQKTKQEAALQNKGEVVKDMMGNPTAVVNPFTGKVIPLSGMPNSIGGLPTLGASGAPTNITTNSAPMVNEADVSMPPDVQARLDQVPPQAKELVKGVLDGRIPPTRQYLGPNPQAIISLAADVDPTFDLANPTARMKTAADYSAAGQSGKMVTSLNTASRHAAATALAALDLNNTSGYPFATTVNAASNAYERRQGDSRLTNYQSYLGNYSHEAIKVISGKSNPGERETEDFAQPFDDSGSPEQILGALSAKNGMMLARAEEMQNSQDKTMGASGRKVQVVSPAAQQAFDDMETLYSASKKGTLNSPEVQQARTRLQAYAAPVTKGSSNSASSIPPPDQRQIGQTYTNPNGVKATWTANGWVQ